MLTFNTFVVKIQETQIPAKTHIFEERYLVSSKEDPCADICNRQKETITKKNDSSISKLSFLLYPLKKNKKRLAFFIAYVILFDLPKRVYGQEL